MKFHSRSLAIRLSGPIALAFALLALLPASSHGAPPKVSTANLEGWSGDNGGRILKALDFAHATRVPGHPPVAAFDWYNTVIKNDVGDATVFWMLKHDLILKP